MGRKDSLFVQVGIEEAELRKVKGAPAISMKPYQGCSVRMHDFVQFKERLGAYLYALYRSS